MYESIMSLTTLYIDIDDAYKGIEIYIYTHGHIIYKKHDIYTYFINIYTCICSKTFLKMEVVH